MYVPIQYCIYCISYRVTVLESIDYGPKTKCPKRHLKDLRDNIYIYILSSWGDIGDRMDQWYRIVFQCDYFHTERFNF